MDHSTFRLRPAAALLVLTLLLAMASPAFAHTEAGAPQGLVNGFLHPLSGPDHLVAMVAVGIWGAQLGAPGIWLLPVCFPLVMAFGGLLGIAGVPLGGVETAVALSAVALGFMVAVALRVRWPIAALVVGGFALFHGYAHGKELPAAADPLAYAVGFVVATGMLHAAGIAIGTLTRWPAGRHAVHAIGAGICGLGAVLLLNLAL